MNKTAQLPITDRQGYEDIDFANEPDPEDEFPAEVQEGESPEEPEEGECVAAFVDEETGEIHDLAAPEQMVLDPNLFPPTKREKVKTVKIGFSGSVEITRRSFEEMCSRQLEPGREVTLTLSGFVPGPHAKWVKRSEGSGEDKMTWWEQEGQVAIKVTDISSEDGIEVGGFYRDAD